MGNAPVTAAPAGTKRTDSAETGMRILFFSFFLGGVESGILKGGDILTCKRRKKSLQKVEM
jgi:hypothetical protein